MDLFKQFKKDFDEIVKNHKGRIIISSHINPDDDSISSVLSLYTYLKDFLKIPNEVKIYYSNNKVDKWESIKYFDQINFVSDISDFIESSDLLLLVDCRDFHRVSNFSEKLLGLKLKVIAIDHHKTTSDSEFLLKLTYPDVFAPSNAELLYQLFYKELSTIDTSLAEILLLGIYGDTNGFRFINKDQLDVMLVAKEIIEKSDIKVDSFLSKLEKYKVIQLNVLGEFLKNVTLIKNSTWGNYSFSYITREFCEKYSREEISSAKALYGAYQKAIEGTGWGFLIYPVSGIDTQWSLSFRSQPGKPNVRLIAQALDSNGGGHDAAAGGKMDEIVLKTKLDAQKILELIQNYLSSHEPQIIPS